MTQPITSTGRLHRTLSFRDLVAYGLAYTAPVASMTMLGFVWEASHGLVALAYLLGAACVYFTAKSYAVMTEILPNAGSVYGFATTALGPFAGFLAGWMILLDYLLIPAFTYGLIAVGMESLIPGVDRSIWIVIVVVVTFTINWFGISVTSRMSFWSVVLQLLVAGCVIIAALIALTNGKGSGALTILPVLNAAHFSLSGVFAATSICVISYLGFDAVSTLAEEVCNDDRRMVGKAILTSLAITSVVFILTSWVLGNLLLGFHYKDPAGIIFELLTWSTGPWSAQLLAWFVVVVVGLTNALPMQAGVARVLYAMGRDGSLPKILAYVHEPSGSPLAAMAIATVVSLCVAIVMRDRLNLLAMIVSVGALTGFMFLHLSVMTYLGRSKPQRKSQRKSGAHVLIPSIGLVTTVAIFISLHSLALLVAAIWLTAGLLYRMTCRTHGSTISRSET